MNKLEIYGIYLHWFLVLWFVKINQFEQDKFPVALFQRDKTNMYAIINEMHNNHVMPLKILILIYKNLLKLKHFLINLIFAFLTCCFLFFLHWKCLFKAIFMVRFLLRTRISCSSTPLALLSGYQGTSIITHL